MCLPKVGRFPTQESPLTVAFRSIGATLAIAVISVSRPVLAQSGSSSFTHTLSVMVQPRVKIVVRNVAAQPAASVAGSATAEGLALSVSATRPWMLLIGSPSGNSTRSRQTLSGQRDVASSSQTGPLTMTSESNVGSAVEASISTGGVAATKAGTQNDGAVMLTIVAP
jgi:hypothetical protein